MTDLDAQRLAAAKLWLTTTPTPNLLNGCGNMPYLATAIYSMTATACSDVETMTADENWRLYVNPDWLDRTDIPRVAAEIAHLVWHLLADHANRARDLDVGVGDVTNWKKASDLAIQATLRDGHIIDAGLPAAADAGLPEDLAAEEYYALLGRLRVTPEPYDQGQPIPGCGSCADGLTRAHELLHSADGDGITRVRAEQIRQAVAIAFKEHVTTYGDTPGWTRRWVDHILNPVVPWQQVLTSAVRRALAWANGLTDYTYTRPSRRQAVNPRLILPALRRPIPHVAVVIDTSASVDDGLLRQALGELDAVLANVGGDGATVISCDTDVHITSRVRHVRDLDLVGAGGTDMGIGLRAAAAQRPAPEVIIVLTDGYTPWPPNSPTCNAVIIALLGRHADLLPATPDWATRVDCVPA